MMRYLAFLFFLAPLAAEEALLPVTHIQAHDVNFDGQCVRLNGEVQMEHVYGTISCNKATLLLPQVDAQQAKSWTPERILLHGQVRITLRDGSSLVSDDADINCVELEGYFTSLPPGKVVYATTLVEGSSQTPLRATSRSLRLKMERVATASGKAEYVFTNFQGEEAVHIEFHNS